MSNTTKCRRCRMPRWKGDDCVNADCPTIKTRRIVLRSKTLPTTATSKHGYHAVNTAGFVQTTSDYDAPIRSTWKRAS